MRIFKTASLVTKPEGSSFFDFLFGKRYQGNRLLGKTISLHKKELARYHAGEYSGHPEEQLELIEDLYRDVKSVKAAKARGWQVDEKSVERIKETYKSWSETTKLTGECFAGGEIYYMNCIRLAEKGLI